MSETKVVTLAVIGLLSVLAGVTFLQVWRIKSFAEATGMGFWKAWFVLG